MCAPSRHRQCAGVKFAWHRTNYGGAAEYLQHIGFDEKEQERLRLSLSSP